MSELKAHRIDNIISAYKIGKAFCMKTEEEAYLKSEVDKVIAELKADYKEACDRLQTANLIKDEQLAATRHSNYKRCLAMAKLCNEKWLVHNFAEIPTKLGFYDKWEKRWLKIAEKFKPN